MSTFQQITNLDQKSGLFDVAMGAYDGAEVCQLVRTFLLYQLSDKYNENYIGLYRDDGLAVFKNISGPQAEKFRNILRYNPSSLCKPILTFKSMFIKSDCMYIPISPQSSAPSHLHVVTLHVVSVSFFFYASFL